MKSSNQRKCKGCGKILSNDPQDLAYTPNLNAAYCQRCFNLLHYGKTEKQNLAKAYVNQALEKLAINEKD